MPYKKLSDREEQELTLAYHCGVEVPALSARYSVSRATIINNILGKRAKQWRDPLIDFYSSNSDRLRNSAHAYVNGEKPYAFGDSHLASFIYRERTNELSGIVREEMYDPRTKKVVQDLGLEYLAKPQGGYIALLDSVFGTSTTSGIVENLLMQRLQEAYRSSEPFSLDVIYSGITEHLADRIRKGGLSITPKKQAIINDILSSFSALEQFSVKHGFGLEGKRYSLQEMGNYVPLPLSRERIRQAQSKALRKLKHPSRSKFLRQIYELAPDDAIEYVFAANTAARPTSVTLATKLSELNLSHAATKMLERYRAETIGDLLEMDARGEIMRGKTGGAPFHEIREKLLLQEYRIFQMMNLESGNL